MTHRAVAIGGAVLLLAALAACAPGPVPSPSTSATSPPTATATPTADPVAERPASRFALTCDDIVSVLQPLFAEPLPAGDHLPALDSAPSWLAGPARYAVDQLGGVVCVFGGTLDTPSATITMVADGRSAADDQQRRVSVATPNAYCELEIDGRAYVCAGTGVAGDVFVELTARGVAGESVDEAVSAFESARDQAIAAAGAPAAAASPGAGGVGASATCETLLPADEVAAILGTDPVSTSSPEGGWSVQAWAIENELGATPCYFTPQGGGDSVALLTWLPGGAWAFEPDATAHAIEIPDAEDAAIGCTADGCTIDVRTAADWFRVTLPAAFGGAAVDDQATEIATTAAANAAVLAQG